MASAVSALSSIVANSPRVMPKFPPPPLFIPYGGLSPVWKPAWLSCTLPKPSPAAFDAVPALLPVSGSASRRLEPRLCPQTLGSARFIMVGWAGGPSFLYLVRRESQFPPSILPSSIFKSADIQNMPPPVPPISKHSALASSTTPPAAKNRAFHWQDIGNLPPRSPQRRSTFGLGYERGRSRVYFDRSLDNGVSSSETCRWTWQLLVWLWVGRFG
jgi:hypothetical protein